MFSEQQIAGDALWTNSTQSMPVQDLSQHLHPAFYYDGRENGRETSVNEPLQLGTTWPGEECAEDEVFQIPHNTAYMVSSSSWDENVAASEGVTVEVPLQGQATLSGSVQLHLP
eukprot:153606-Amphidinium_carterae.1